MKRRKLFYIPGLISIIGLPVLLFLFGPREVARPTVMKIFIPTNKKDLPGLIRFSNDYVYRSIKKKKVVTIDLDEERDDEYDNKRSYLFYRKRNFISHEIERMQFTNDTSCVLKVRLGYENTYGDFVWMFNQAILYDIKRFAFVDDNYYLFANKPVIHFSPEVLEVDVSSDIVMPSTPRSTPAKWDIFKKNLLAGLRSALFIVRYSYLYVTGFLVFIVLPGIAGLVRVFLARRS